jgi:hypothetical protein
MKKTIVVLLMALSGVLAQKKVPWERYGETDLPLIRTKVRFTTLIVLPEGEEVADVICGDKDYWVIEGKDSIVYVKPAKERVRTNVNVIAKSKTVYSFLVQEISNPASSKEQPDLKVVLGGDELSKVKKDRENLEELLARTERSVADLKSQNDELKSKAEAESRKKKDDAAPRKVDSSKGVVAGWEVNPTREPKAETDMSHPAAGISVPAQSTPASEQPAETLPVVGTSYTVSKPATDPDEPFLWKSGRAVGRFFKRVGHTLRLY